MTIWFAALYSLGILGLSAIFFALCTCVIMWAVEGEHMVVLWAAAFIACWVVFTICIYIEGGAA